MLEKKIINNWKKNSKVGFSNVWLECDSSVLVCVAFTVMTNVSSMLRNR